MLIPQNPSKACRSTSRIAVQSGLVSRRLSPVSGGGAPGSRRSITSRVAKSSNPDLLQTPVDVGYKAGE